MESKAKTIGVDDSRNWLIIHGSERLELVGSENVSVPGGTSLATGRATKHHEGSE